MDLFAADAITDPQIGINDYGQACKTSGGVN